MTSTPPSQPLGLLIQPACLQHRYIRHPNASHIFERPERLRAVLLGVAAAVARLEDSTNSIPVASSSASGSIPKSTSDDLSSMLSGLSIAATASSTPPSRHLNVVPPPQPPLQPGNILLHHPALQLAHSTPADGTLPYSGAGSSGGRVHASSTYLKELRQWASEAVEKIKETGCEIPGDRGLNQGDLYLGPGSILAIEGAVQTVCQAVERVCAAASPTAVPKTPEQFHGHEYFDTTASPFRKAFCAIRPPGHHCGEDTPSGFCYVNNVVVGALHAYLEHDVDRAIIIDFDLHHGNGTQALVMPLNATSHAEDLAVKAGKPRSGLLGKGGRPRRGWKGFYGSVHDIYSYPCEDGDLDLITDASISLAAHGQYIENIHLQPYSSEADFYERIYPKYLALLDRAKHYMEETAAEPDRTIIFISAGFDACEHEYQAMQRHDRRVPTSFFSRYTRDIVAFADRYTQGKVVSVLEGGYSDRALTSAAMGHVLGLLDQPGRGDWWTEEELVTIEKATKKKRTGKIAPFPTEYSRYPHLQRTHALLSSFEGFELPPSTASTASTPQQAGRMTLRGRTKAADSDEFSTPPTVLRRGRGRGTATPARPRVVTASAPGTPTAKRASAQANGSPSKPLAKILHPDLHTLPPLPPSPAPPADQLPGLPVHAIKSEPSAPVPQVPPVPLQPTLPPVVSQAQVAEPPPIVHVPQTSSHPTQLSANPDQPRIMLRFRHPSSSPDPSATPGPAPAPESTSEPLAGLTASSLYPSLPPTEGMDRYAYREGSAATTSSVGSEPPSEAYVSALSSVSPEVEVKREEREKSTASSISDGPQLPGAFGR